MSADIIQFRDYQIAARISRATTLDAFVNALTSEQSHYHNLAEPILDTAPSEYSPPEAS